MTDKQFLSAIGKRIKELRKSKNIAQNDLAYSCDFDPPSMARIEAGKTNPTILTLKKIAKELNISVAELLEVNI